MKKIILSLSVLVSACNQPANQYHVSSYYLWSAGSDTLPSIRGMSQTLIEKGWAASLHSPGWADQKTITDREKWFGAEALIIHLPFGRNPNEDFDFAGFTTSQKDIRLSKVTDTNEFVKAWSSFSKETGIKKILFYYGYIGADHKVWDNISIEQKKKLIIDNVEPIHQLQITLKTMGAETGILIDTLSQRTDPNDDNWILALPYIKSLGLLYGGEPWPNPAAPSLSDKNYLNVFDGRQVWLFDPEVNPNASWSAPRSKVAGNITDLVIEEYPNGVLESMDHYRAKALYALKKYRNISYGVPVDGVLTAQDLIKQAKADTTSCIDQNGFLSCCATVNEKVGCTTSIHGAIPVVNGLLNKSMRLK